MTIPKVVRLGVSAFFLLVVYGGAFRKWFMPSYSQFFFVLKDMILAGTFGVFLLTRGLVIPKGLYRTLYGYALAILVGYGALEVFNPALPSVLLGIWGFKSHLLYSCLIILIPFGFGSFSHLRRYLRWYLLLSLPVLILCIVQFNMPIDHVLNVYARSEHVNYLPGIRAPRVTGTFPSNAGMGSYSFLATYLAALFLVMKRGGLSLRTAPYYLIFVTGWVVVFMTGGRWPLFAWLMMVVLWGFLSMTVLNLGSILLGMLEIRWVVSVILVAVLSYLVISLYATDALEATTARLTAGTNETQRRLTERVFQPYQYMDDVGLFGYGVGSTYQAAEVLTDAPKFSWLASHLKIEEAPERSMIELGFVGYMVLMFNFLTLYYLGFRTLLHLQPYQARILGIGAYSFIFLGFTEQIVYHSYTSAFYWGFVGIIIALRSWGKINGNLLEAEGEPVGATS